MKIKIRRRPLGNVALLAKANIPLLLKRLYVQRGVRTVRELETSTRSLLSYYSLAGIHQAVDLLTKVIVDQRKLIVVGDFDADGATGIALTMLALRRLGVKNLDFLVPNRFKDGYGLSPAMVTQVEDRGGQTILTVDNGISSHEGVDLAKKKGISVLITDHHLPDDVLPSADAIVNPNLLGCKFISKSLSGVGVAFYLMLALRAHLNKSGWFIQNNRKIPKLADLLDLVAVGTISDAVPLDHNNRILVHQGLSRIRAGYCRPGILALSKISNLDWTRLCVTDLSFKIGPLLNAAGRLEDMSTGVLLLLTNNYLQAKMLAMELHSLNHSRRFIENRMVVEALKLCKTTLTEKKTMPLGLTVYHTTWHQGVVGILASRIKDRFHRPVIAFAPAEKGLLKGSGRSINGLHILNLLKNLNKLHPGLMLKFGGHAMAAGLVLARTHLDQFSECFSDLVSQYLNPALLENIIWSDGNLEDHELSLHTAELLREAGPWGQGFPDPIFDGRFRIINQKVVGKKHLKLTLKSIHGDRTIEGIAFNIDLDLWPDSTIETVELAYKLEVNTFKQKRSLQLLIEYIQSI